jgi:hypothetical protein
MGAWGTALYSDDTTCEVRDEFKSHLESGMSHSVAEKAILERFSDVLSDHQVECLVYFSLAETQWKFGCLSDHVRQHTLALLGKGGDVKYWQEDAPLEAKARAKVLAALSARLLSPQPPLKQVKLKLRRLPRKQLNAPVGSVFGLSLPNGNIAALKFVGLRLAGSLEEAVFRLLPWRGTKLSSLSILEKISDRAVMIDDYHEFSLYISDSRKNPTNCLLRTDILFAPSSPIDSARNVAVNIKFLPEKVQNALSNL